LWWLPVVRARWTEHAQTGVRRLAEPSGGAGRHRQRLFVVNPQVPLLEPTHENLRQASCASIRIALAPLNMPAVGEIRWVWLRQQSDECVETDGVDDLQHFRFPRSNEH
jgi:hypothetical protein